MDDEESDDTSPLDVLVARLDWARCAKTVDCETADGLRAVLSAFCQSDALVFRRPNSQLAKKREAFVKNLAVALQRVGLSEELGTVEKRLKEAALWELCFEQLLATLPKTAPGRLRPEVHAWALVERFAAESNQIEADTFAFFRSNKAAVDPMTASVTDATGYSYRPDAALGKLAEITGSSLVMLAIQQGWLDPDGKVLLPPRVEITDQDIYAVGITGYLGNAFHGIGDCVERWRFLEGDVTDATMNVEMSPGEVHEARMVRYSPTFSDAELLDHVATERLNRVIAENAMKLDLEATVRNVVENGPARLAPSQYVSNDEAYAAVALCSLLHFNVLEDTTRYGGLTFGEWIRGYSWLRQRAVDSASSVDSLSRVNATTELQNLGLSPETASLFLAQASLHRGKTDLFDTPLIESRDGSYTYHAHTFQSVSVPRIVLSRLAAIGVSIARKGKAFENEALQLFAGAGFQPRNVKFKREGEDYEYDVVFVWDDTLFVFECKSYSIPLLRPMQLHWYVGKMDRAAAQVLRLCGAVVKYRDAVVEQLGPGVTWTRVVPCVLNSLPWSAGLREDGVFVLDYSAVKRFFDSRTLFVNVPAQIDNVKLLVRHHLKSLYPESGPTPGHFLREMEVPWQVLSIATGFQREEVRAVVGENVVFEGAFIRPAPPDMPRAMAAIGVANPTKDLKVIWGGIDKLRRDLARSENAGNAPQVGSKKPRKPSRKKPPPKRRR